MRSPLPIVFIGDDYDDFSIFDLAVQEVNQSQEVLWLQCPHSLLNNPTPVCCIVVDVPARYTPVEPDLQTIGQFAKENAYSLFIYTTDPQIVELRLKNVRVAEIIPKYVRFDLLVEQLKKLFHSCLN